MKRRTLAIAAVTAVTLALAAPPASATTTARPATAAPAVAALAAPDVQVSNVQAHLAQLQSIATSNGGNRRAGRAGYTASVDLREGQAPGRRLHGHRADLHPAAPPGHNVIADWPGGDDHRRRHVRRAPRQRRRRSGHQRQRLRLGAPCWRTRWRWPEQNPTMTKHVRFAWWNGEEQGLQRLQVLRQLPDHRAEGRRSRGTTTSTWSARTNGGYFINRHHLDHRPRR